MDFIFDYVLNGLGWVLLLFGSLFSIIGGLGIVRLPDFYSRLHGGGITDTLGAGLIMCGLMLMTFSLKIASLLVVAKLFMILAFLSITSPTACHALAQSALSSGLQPLTGKPNAQKTLDEDRTSKSEERS